MGGKLGFVGEPTKLNKPYINKLLSRGIVPIISPIGYDNKNNSYNINADTAAGAIAAALNATRMLMLTDVTGVLDQNGKLISSLTISQAEAFIHNGTISGGMIPKVKTCIDAVQGGAEGAVIIDGRAPHALLVELFTEHGMGTMITAD